MYNSAIKEKFISNYRESSQDVIKNVFKHTESEEELLAMDLYDFGIDEIKRVLQSFNPQTLNSSVLMGRIILNYMRWASQQGYRNSNIIPLEGLGDDFYLQFIQNVKLYYSEDEIKTILSELINYQDRIVIWLLFQGVKMEELLNLKVYDVDFENGILNLQNNNGEQRKLDLWDKEYSLNVIQGAIDQSEYYVNNGVPRETVRVKIREIIKTEYVFRKVKTQSIFSKPIPHNIFQRLNNIKEYFGDYYTITPKKLQQSGMIKMAKDLIIRDGKLENQQLMEIADRFKFNIIHTNGYKKFTTIKKIVNIDNIKKLYSEI